MAIWPVGATTASGTLSGTLIGPRIESVALSKVAFSGPVTPLRDAAHRPLVAQSINVTIALTGSASGPANGPFAITASGSANAPFIYTDPAANAFVNEVLSGSLSGALTLLQTLAVRGSLSGSVSGASAGTIAIANAPIVATAMPAAASGPIVEITRQLNGIAARGTISGPAVGPLTGTVTAPVNATFAYDTRGADVQTLNVSGSATAQVVAAGRSFPPLAETLGGSVDVTVGAALPQVACVAVPITVEVVDAAMAGRGSVSVTLTTSQGDVESIVLRESAAGRFIATGLPIARAGAVRVRDGFVEVLDPGALLSLSYTARNGQPATATVDLR